MFLKYLLYNQTIKNTANFFLSQSWLLSNPLYQHLQNKKINQTIDKYKKVPFALRIENTNLCNAACFMCPHPQMRRKKGVMSRKLYKKIIDQAASLGIDYINLHNFGEPLLDHDFIWRVKYAKNKGIKKISTNTNAQTLNKKLARQIVNSGLDEIYISLDAATKSTYKKIRIGLDFDKVTTNVRSLIKLRPKLASSTPIITVDFLESSLNNNETQKFITQWRNLADNVCISKIHDWSAKKQSLTKEKFSNYVSFSKAPCRLPFTELLINWDGTVNLCCQDIEGEIVLGDANKQSLTQIWTSKKYQIIRNKHRQIKIDKLPLCNDC